MQRGWNKNVNEPDPVSYDKVKCVKQSDKAIWCEFTAVQGCPRLWVPKSCIEDDSEVKESGDDGTLVLKGWFVEKTFATELQEKINEQQAIGRVNRTGQKQKVATTVYNTDEVSISVNGKKIGTISNLKYGPDKPSARRRPRFSKGLT